VIKLETAHIEEVRGIRKLNIDFKKATFAISGPNGSGKSGVIDAIEFGLTGQIGRLTGRGTKGLSVSEHGPHVDKTKFPDAAFVELRVFLPAIGKTATITRKVSAPKKPKIVPAGEDVKAALAEVAEHPEVTLSRREILRFILVEPTKRSEEIQTLLKLDDIGQTRSALNTAQNKLQTAQVTATAQVQSSRNALQTHLQISTLLSADVLEEVNKRRKVLVLPEIAELTADTKLDAGLSANDKGSDFNKKSALGDLNALFEAAKKFPDLAKKQAAAIVADLVKLETDPALLTALQRRSLIEKGLDLIDGPDCPLCDTPWEDEQHLRSHLEAKLAKSEEAGKLQQSMLSNGTAIATEAIRVIGLLTPVQKLADTQGDGSFTTLLTLWKADLEALKAKSPGRRGPPRHDGAGRGERQWHGVSRLRRFQQQSRRNRHADAGAPGTMPAAGGAGIEGAAITCRAAPGPMPVVRSATTRRRRGHRGQRLHDQARNPGAAFRGSACRPEFAKV
jgi:hypothetical protein